MAFTLTNEFNVTDDATLKLDRAFSVTTAVVGGTTYLFAAGFTDDGVSVFSVAADGSLTNVDNVTDTVGLLELDGAISVTTAVVGVTTYLFVAGLDDDGVSVFSVAANGALTNVANVTDAVGAVLLDGVRSVTTAVVGGTTYLFTAGQIDSGVSVFSVAANGALTNVDNVTDDLTLELSGAISVTTAVVGGTTYLFVAGNADDGISVFSVAAGGALTSVFNVTDDAALKLDGAFSLTTAVVGGTTYLYAAGTNDDGISVFSVAANGALTNLQNVTDDATLKLDGVRNVTTAVIGGTTYLFAAGDIDDGVSVFSVAANGALTNVANVSDDATLELDGTISVTTAVVGGTTYLFTAAQNDDGISVFVADDGVNEAPVNAGVVAFTPSEDTGYSITGLSITDTDANNATNVTTTLSVVSGTLTVLTAGGAAVAGSGTASVTLTGSVTQINITLAAANNVVYQGSLNFNGGDTLTVLTSDNGNTGTPGALTDTDTAAITVNAVNDAPVAVDDALSSVAEDSGVRTITFAALTGNDGDGDPDVAQALTITAVSNFVGGTAVIDGTDVKFTPTADYNGTASFDYTVQDNGQSNGIDDFKTDVGTASFTVTEVNDKLHSVNETLSSVAEDSGMRVIAFTDLTGNDSTGPANESGQTLTITAVSNAVGGTAVINGTNIEFTPTADFNGTASFIYTEQDNGTTNGADDFTTDIGMASFTVTAVNDAPVANDDIAATDENTILSVAVADGLLKNDTDADFDILKIVQAYPVLTTSDPDADPDGDGIKTSKDNAPSVYNPSQSDQDGNGFGDVIDFTRAAGGFVDSLAIPGSVSPGATLTVKSDGAYVFNPNGAYEYLGSGQTAVETFYYAISDGNGGSDLAQFDVTINGVNDAPSLTGLATSVTFLENTVNATPQLIDTDVVFTDPDNNFDGGTLTVTGLLAQDTVAINNQGTGAGQIGFSAGNVSYENILIGTASGGAGGTLTVTFNAAATSTAIDALIQNLTYANFSDTPTAARTLTVTVTDAAGAVTLGAPSFTQQTGAANPFDVATFGAAFDVGLESSPDLVDVDGDGDLDAVVGKYDGTFDYFKNTGTASSPVFTQQNGTDNPFGTFDVGFRSNPSFGDLDGDGDLDFVSGDTAGLVHTFQNNAGVFTELTGAGNNPFNGVNVGPRSAPSLVDLDGDGDLDAVIGENSGGLFYFKNTAGVFTQQTGAANPFNTVDVGFYSTPIFGDLDGDGDLDALVGERDNRIFYYENTGTAGSPQFALDGTVSPFNGGALGVGIKLVPSLGDLDGDGDLDAVVGELDGNLNYFRNNSAGAPITVNVTAQNDAPTATATALSPTFTEPAGLGTQGQPVTVFSGAAVNTVEAGQLITSLTFTVSGLADGSAERVNVDGTQLIPTVNFTGITAGNGMSYNVNNNGATSTVTLTKAAGVAPADIQTLIDGITYVNINTDAPTTGDRVFTLTAIKDNGGIASGGVDTTTLGIASSVHVVATNDAPETNAASASGLEDAASIAVALSGSDVDGTVASFKITSPVGNGTLYADSGLTTPLAQNSTVAASGNAATVYFVPAANFNGATSFFYAAVDDMGLEDTTSPFDGLVEFDPADTVVLVADISVASEGFSFVSEDSNPFTGPFLRYVQNYADGTLDFAPEGENFIGANGVRIENIAGVNFDFSGFDIHGSVRTTDLQITASNGETFNSTVSFGGGGSGAPFNGVSQSFDFSVSNQFDNVEWVEINFTGTAPFGPNVFLDNFALDLANATINIAAVNDAPVTLAPPVAGTSPFFGPAVASPFPADGGQLIQPYGDPYNLALASGPAEQAVVSFGATGFHGAEGINDGYYGNPSSWIPFANPAWLKIDLGQLSLIDTVAFGRDRTGTFADRSPGVFTISVATSDGVYANGNSSNDTTEYSLVFTGNIGGYDATRSFVAQFPAITGRYIKIEFSNGNVAIDEVQVYAASPLSPTLAAIAEDTAAPAGATVSALYTAAFSDAADQVAGGSSANTFAGIAISGHTTDASKGNWQYSTDGGANWVSLGNATTTAAITLAAADMLRFVPAANYNGSATTLSSNLIESGLVITSGAAINLSGATGSATHISSATVPLNHTITEVNDAPTANTDSATVVEDSSGNVITVLANDSKGPTNESGQSLTIISATASHGTVTINANGTLSYTPAANYNGADTINYTIRDNGTTNGVADPLQSSSTVSVTVTAVNDAPVAVDDTLAATEDTPVIYTAAQLLGNDTDVDNTNLQLSIFSVTSGTGGTAALNGNGTVTFTPSLNFVGAASFTYTTSDGTGTSNTATVTVNVAAGNVAPVAKDVSASAGEDGPAATILADFTDVDAGDVHTFSVDTTGTIGSVTNNADGTFSYDPNGQFESLTASGTAQDTFTYTVDDGQGGSDTKTVTVTINGRNDAPVANADSYLTPALTTALTTSPGTSLPIAMAALLANDTDIDVGDTLSITSVSGALHGTVMISGSDVIFAPTFGYLGAAGFDYTISDGNGGTASAHVSLSVVANAITGTAGGTTITGTGGADIIDAGKGNDTVNAGDGNDIIVASVGDGNDTYNGGEGSDTLDLSALTAAVRVRLGMPVSGSNGRAEGTQVVDDTLISIENVIGGSGSDLIHGNDVANYLDGGAGNDMLSGFGGADTLIGGSGNDTLDGGTGGDQMAGGIGNDIYTVDNAGDTVTETTSGAPGGTDLVKSSVTFILGDNVENLTLTGTVAINGTGNSGANTILGNSASNTLDGGIDLLATTVDQLKGGAGDDTYIVRNTNDKVTELAGQGTDTVKSEIAYVLGLNVENLVLQGTSALDGTGNTLNNTITGNSGDNVLNGMTGNDTLNGGIGADTLIGGLGNDMLTGGADADHFLFNAALNTATNVDHVTDFQAGDHIDLSHLIFLAAGAIGGLTNDAFHTGLTAHDATDRIIYNNLTGDLFYDKDGTGAAAQVKFATLDTLPALTHADIFVV